MPDRDQPTISTLVQPKGYAGIKAGAACLLALAWMVLIVGGSIALANFWQAHLPAWEGQGAIVALLVVIALGVGYARVQRFQSAFFVLILFVLIVGICLAIFHGWIGYVVLLAVVAGIANLIFTARRAARLSRAQHHLDQALSKITALSHAQLDPSDEDVQAISQMLESLSQPDQADDQRNSA